MVGARSPCATLWSTWKKRRFTVGEMDHPPRNVMKPLSWSCPSICASFDSEPYFQ